jgi:hypothetical protein
MSQQFLKNLECLCIKDVSGTCPGGGGLNATLTASASLFCDVVSKNSKISSPGRKLNCTGELDSVDGTGPYYTVKFKEDAGPNCADIEGGWTLTIGSTEYAVTNVNNDGSLLIFGLDNAIESFSGVTVKVEGVGLPDPPDLIRCASTSADLSVTSSLGSTLAAYLGVGETTFLIGAGSIIDDLTANYSLGEHLEFTGHLINTITDKVAGDFGDFECIQKLYPSGDLPIASGFGKFIGPSLQTTDLYTFIDEGVYDGILKDGGSASLLSDDKKTFINPDTIHTEGLFQYKCNLTSLDARPDETRIRMRVSAPIKNFESNIAPQYTVYNIKLADPSGNLIVKYKDIVMRGDSDSKDNNYATYSSAPEINVVSELYDWQRTETPFLHMGGGYSLSFSVRAVAFDDPFDPGFSEGFEENYILPDIVSDDSGNNYLALDGAPLSAQEENFINPTAGFRVSAIEICNSGGLGPRPESYIPVYIEVDSKGRRLERSITPSYMHLATFDTTIYPSVSSVWQKSDDSSVSNLDICGAEELTKILSINNIRDSIKLDSTSGGDVADSGKLILKFSHLGSEVSEITKGAFNIEFDQGTKNIWWSPSGSFNVENRTFDHKFDIPFFTVDTLTLKVIAKKDAGTRDYILDVVGYSDDKLLNVTSPSGGFVQNPSGVYLNDTFVSSVGTHPVFSGFYSDSNEFALGGTSVSEREKYFEGSGKVGGDHYSLTQYPVVTGTEFESYEVPLIISDDIVKLGKSRDYTLSSLLEHVYLDIFPLPSGASIAHISLDVRYAPQNAVNLITQGGEKLGQIQDGRSEGALFPRTMQSNDRILNAGSGYAPLSHIDSIPHAYQTPSSIKSNYSRRWRGREGTVQGPFDPDMFTLGFENPLVDFPFLSGYYTFDDIETSYTKSVPLGSGFGSVSGLFSATPEIYQNVGWRFSSGTLFSKQLPTFSGNYTTTDWTSLSKGVTTFIGNPMYGKIADAFDRVVRISGDSQNINFGNIDTTSGFAIFTRFTPDANVSGVGYDLFNSGVIFAKWDTANELDFALGYKNGYLCGYAKNDTDGSIVQVVDTIKYSGYQFPLNVILTYNDNQSSGLKLYTDNEVHKGEFTTLRASSSKFYKNTTDANLVLGWAAGSGVGMNMLVSEFGISTWSSGVDTLYGSGTNIVESNADKTYKGVTAQKFLEASRVKFFDPSESYTNDTYKLWDYVNEDTYNDWQIGAFKYCEFDLAFNQLQKRPNMEQIVFDIKHHGSGYSTYNDLAMPALIDSGVSYHTQIENDFLRFHLSDVPDNFYSTNRRITKNLPTSYKFSERALVVESVIWHHTDNTITWPDCKQNEGPRLIVSLYTKKQEPYWTPDESNWGLVNRKIHYLEPSSCLMRLDSTFTYNDINDTSEEWAIFPAEPRIKEFTEKYFSDDIDDMFVQYDLVYPSGPAFESKIQLHSSHVRMANANIYSRSAFESGILYMSGGYPSTESMNLVLAEIKTDVSGMLPLFLNVPIPVDNLPSGFSLNVSGAYSTWATLPLWTPQHSVSGFFNLNVSGADPFNAGFNKLNLTMPETYATLCVGPGPEGVDGVWGCKPTLPLFILNNDVGSSDSLPLFSFGTNGSGLYDHIPIYLHSDHANTTEGYASGDITLMTVGIGKLVSAFKEVQMPLFIDAPNIIDEWIPLTLGYTDPSPEAANDNVNLFTASYPVGSKGFGSAYGLWFNNNYGTGIELEDNYLAAIGVDNEIRGVDLTAYGSCTGDSQSKAIDPPLVTDDTAWGSETCNDGGIFRAKATYTNSGAINFEGGFGYSGNYYGIRKFTQLLPSLAYNTELTIKTGSTEPIPVPRNFEDWEYGMCGPDWYLDSGCCTADCDQNLAYSGAKFIGDDSNLLIDPELLAVSGRNIDDNYGYKVSVKGDLMAISAPKLDIPDSQGNVISSGGMVFLYRRDTDVAGKKAPWKLIDQLMLPDGYRRDYIHRTIADLLVFGDLTISGNKWQIGQEGREFGSSLDMCSSGTRETLVIGAPRAKWTREFDDIQTSGIPCGTLVVADLFKYNKKELAGVGSTAKKFNILWKYFSAPWYGGQPKEFQPQVDMKVIVLQIVFANKPQPPVPNDEDWFVHRYINRLDDYDLLVNVGSGALGGSGTSSRFFASGLPIIYNEMVDTLKEAFFEAFPTGNSSLVYSGVPAIFGMFKESTGSTAGALQYTDSDGNIKSVYDAFEDFYNAHTFASGVFDQTTGLSASGHLNTIKGKSETWHGSTINLIGNTFDSGRLSTTYTNSTLNRDFITSGVGQEWGEAHAFNVREFQIPPQSGGRVYIFEKERDNFNCIQVITSPNDISDFLETDVWDEEGVGDDDNKRFLSPEREYNDRFGHSVGISHNSEIVTIGSPFSSSACRIYERDDKENQEVYNNVRDWAEYRNKSDAVSHYDAILIASGKIVAQESTYDFLSSSDRFYLRNDVDYWARDIFGKVPNPYKLSFSYHYDDISLTGTNLFVPYAFAPTSRLGWSTAVSDHGDTVAFGAPTDSFNEFEDGNVYAESQNSWASYQHAGAVRMFHSRNNYPHSGVIEFGRFGNLDRSLHKAERDQGFYDQLGLYFGANADGTTTYKAKYFRRTDFSEIEIPKDAGLAFIMTPELDASSDEIMDNIKRWLMLGDRTLVLVGNDPTWEDNGAYGPSNDIVNTLLDKLGSRLRIHPAKNKSLSLPECVSEADKQDNKYNITPSFQPHYRTVSTVERSNYYAKGVGDIRIDLSKDGLENFKGYMSCPEGAYGNVINNKFELPLRHDGDLRAEWKTQCVITSPKGTKTVVNFFNNWPLSFGNFVPNCDIPPVPVVKAAGFDPVPVLTTAEHTPARYWHEPATSGRFSEWEDIFIIETFKVNSPYADFKDFNLDKIAFNIEEDINSDPSGIFNLFDIGSFDDPSPKNERDGLVQATGTLFTGGKPRKKIITLYDDSILAITESGVTDEGEFNNSRIYLVATQWGEDDGSRGIDYATVNDDKNTEFYINMVANSCDEAPKGVHLGGWTGNTSLNDAYHGAATATNNHSLANKFRTEFEGRQHGGYFVENKIYENGAFINDAVDFVWIASPLGKPSSYDLNRLKKWMDIGNKKLIITYSAGNPRTTQKIASSVDYLCSGLNISSRPLFVPQHGEYFVANDIITAWNTEGGSVGRYKQFVTSETDSLSGCPEGYKFTNAYNEATSLSGVHFSKDTNESWNGNTDFTSEKEWSLRDFVPISGGQNYERILWFDPSVDITINEMPDPRWKIDAESSLTFPTIKGSGYRLFFNWVSEKTTEKFSILGSLEGVKYQPNACDYFPLLDECRGDVPVEADPGDKDLEFSSTFPLAPALLAMDIVAMGEEVKVGFNTNNYKYGIDPAFVQDGVVPTTVRILSVSGCPLPIESGITVTEKKRKKKIGSREVNIRWEVYPARSGLVPGVSRPVMHESRPYREPNADTSHLSDDIAAKCERLGDALIEDGPVVVAEEYETFSLFPNGKQRSKIIVVSDSTLLQGQCPHYRGDALIGNQALIRSFYPPSPETLGMKPGNDQFSNRAQVPFADDLDPEETAVGGRAFYFAQKLRAPERGSVAKYHAVSGASVSNMTEPLYDEMGGSLGDLDRFTDEEDYTHPANISRPAELMGPEVIKNEIKRWGNAARAEYGIHPKYSGDHLNIGEYRECLGLASNIERPWIADAGNHGGLNDLMMCNNTDYLDLDIYYSGCLGDLFGYSIDLTDDKLVVGTPFNAFYTEGAISGISGIVRWHEIQNDPNFSGLKVAEDGGAGAAFCFENTWNGKNVVAEYLPWEFIAKIKPSSLNIGISDFSPSPAQALTRERGPHEMDDSNFILEYGKRSDNFGYSVAIDADMIAVGAPNHDFETLHHHVYSGSVDLGGLNSAFQRKSFDGAFDIPLHSYYDLGGSGVRVDDFSNNSGVMILNNGAVFNYRHELVDFQNKKKQWIFAEKLNAQGYNDRVSSDYIDVLGTPYLSVSGSENDRFGWSVAIDRAKRGDSDYTLIIGAPQHDWPVSGNHTSSGLDNAGSAYTFDAMLRGQTPTIPNSGSWIDVNVFAGKIDADDSMLTRVYQNTDGDPISYMTSGMVSSNNNGDMFLEVSGFDPATKGFIAHRPFVESVKFILATGTVESDSISLFIDGKPVDFSGNMPLSLLGADQANVYNNMNLYHAGIGGSSSGTMNMFLEVASGASSGALNLNLGVPQAIENLRLRIRGY